LNIDNFDFFDQNWVDFFKKKSKILIKKLKILTKKVINLDKKTRMLSNF